MPRENLKYVAVYLTEAQWLALREAAAQQNRSLSNYLLTLGLKEAERLGFHTGGEESKRKSA